MPGWDLQSLGPSQADSVKIPPVNCSHIPWNSVVLADSLSLLSEKMAAFLPYQAMQHQFQFIC